MSAVDALVDEVVAAPGFNADLAISRLIAELDALGRLTLVIDDVHEIKSPDLLVQLTSFLGQLPSGTHVVLISRHDPQLGLHRRRLEGQLSEIRIDQLRFTVDESRELFAGPGSTCRTTDCNCSRPVPRDGWQGLRLAAVSMATHPDPEDSSWSSREASGRWPSISSPKSWTACPRMSGGCSSTRRFWTGSTVRSATSDRRHRLRAPSQFAHGDRGVRDPPRRQRRVVPLPPPVRRSVGHRAPTGTRRRDPGLHLAAAHWLSAHGNVLEAIITRWPRTSMTWSPACWSSTISPSCSMAAKQQFGPWSMPQSAGQRP
jgi:hypothetical protein